MHPLLIIGIIVLIALLLFAVEAFITPGFGVAGIGATLCVVVADSLTFYYYGGFAATLALLVSTAAVLLLIWWIAHSRAVEKISLHANIDSTAATAAQLSVRPGEKGHALTRLALIGNAEIAGRQVEVKSAGGFIDEGTPVVVTAVQDALILVRPCAEADHF